MRCSRTVLRDTSSSSRASACSAFALLIASGLLSCTRASSERIAHRQLPIVGGALADPSEYPSTVAITDPAGTVFCTGTLVSPTVVVTAAHCLETETSSSIRVVYGYSVPKSAPASYRLPVSLVQAHPQYNGKLEGDSDGLAQQNDVGIVVLADPIPNAVVAPIVAASEIDNELTPLRQIHIVGYGQTNEWNPNSAGTLYKALTPYKRHIVWEMLAGEPGEPDTCNGDSGGPAYVQEQDGSIRLIGITSRMWAGSTNSCGDGGIYTLAGAYADWLQSLGGPLGGKPSADAGSGCDAGMGIDASLQSDTGAPDSPSFDAQLTADSPFEGHSDSDEDADAQSSMIFGPSASGGCSIGATAPGSWGKIALLGWIVLLRGALRVRRATRPSS